MHRHGTKLLVSATEQNKYTKSNFNNIGKSRISKELS